MERSSGTWQGPNTSSKNIKTKDFAFLDEGCEFTDDTVMTVAVARALMYSYNEEKSFKPALVREMQIMGRRYPNAGYGGRFFRWIKSPYPKPFNSYGNGSAMRVSPCGLFAVTLEEALALAKASAEVTHNHPEAIKGAQAVAAAIYMARTWRSKEDIRAYIRENFYPLNETLDQIRPGYEFDVSCQGSVPQAIEAFLESESYEDAIRNAISIGGDSDTIAAITGGIAWSYYRFNPEESGPCTNGKKPQRIWPDECDRIVEEYGVNNMLPKGFVETIDQFDLICANRAGTYDRVGICTGIQME